MPWDAGLAGDAGDEWIAEDDAGTIVGCRAEPAGLLLAPLAFTGDEAPRSVRLRLSPATPRPRPVAEPPLTAGASAPSPSPAR